MKFALCNEVLQPMPFAEQCKFAAALGYDGLEVAPFTLAEDPMTITDAQAIDYRRIAEDAGLTIFGLHWLLVAPRGLSIVSGDAAVRERTVGVMRRLTELCAVMGGNYLVHGSPKQRSTPPGSTKEQALERATECFAQVATTATHLAVTYCVEPLSTRETDLIHMVAEAARIVDQVASPGLKTMIDCSSAGQVEPEPIETLMERWMPSGHIAHVQVNDPNRRGPGQGEMQFAPILATIARMQAAGHYRGIVAVEPFDYVPDGPGCAARAIGYLKGIAEGVAPVVESPRFAVREIELYERPVVLRLPFKFGVVTLTHSPQAFVRARIETSDGRSAWGAAAEMLAPKWFDKNLQLSNEDNFEQLRDVLRLARDAYLGDAAPATAFGHFARHYAVVQQKAGARGHNPLLANYGPALVDRAILDALGRSFGVSFYAAMNANLAGIGADRPEFAGFDFGAFLARLAPAASIEARHTVGMVDAITEGELTSRVGDGLPETLEEVVATWGHRYFKLKVGGQVASDIPRLEAIASVLDRLAQPYFVSLDGNEQYADAQGVRELVDGIRARPSLRRLWDSILFIEQPIARKVALDVDLQAVDLGKPVIIDESDSELDTFVRARERGYRGVSSKTCKGFYKSILNAARCAAWNSQAGETRYFMSAEDLTTQAGLSVQQDLALVNFLGITHVERNGHYYVNGMAALSEGEQQAFINAHPDVYEHSHGAVRVKIEQGRIAIGSLDCKGFASAAMPDFASMAPISR